MLNLSKKSLKEYKTLHPDLKAIISVYLDLGKTDVSLVDGLRTDKEQKEMYEQGLSTLDGFVDRSKHQADEEGYSHAVDFRCYTHQNKYKKKIAYDWSHLSRVAGSLEAIAHCLYSEGKISHLLRWGGDWDSDGVIGYDHNLIDLCHIELIGP